MIPSCKVYILYREAVPMLSIYSPWLLSHTVKRKLMLACGCNYADIVGPIISDLSKAADTPSLPM